MNVLFDLSFFAKESFLKGNEENGTIRVTKALIVYLRQREDVNLRFVITQSFEALNEYVLNHWEHDFFSGCPVSYSIGELSVCHEDLEEADIIYFPSPMEECSRLLEGYPHIKSVVTIHDLMPIVCPEYFTMEGMRSYAHILRSHRDCYCFICVSESTRWDLCRFLHLDSKDVCVTYPAADPQVFYRCDDRKRMSEVRDKYSIPDGQYIIACSRLQLRKNVGMLLRCFENVVANENIENISLVLTGVQTNVNDTEAFDLIVRLSASPQFAGKIICSTMSYVDDEDFAPLYSEALCFVMPSLYEGFGLPVLEAMQCGVPVIASSTSSFPEVVGDAAMLIDPYNDDDLYHAIMKLYREPDMRKIMAEKGMRRAKKFSWERYGQDVVNAFNVAMSH